MNVNAYATYIFPKYEGPKFDLTHDALLTDVRSAESDKQSIGIMMDAMSSLASGSKFLKPNLNTRMGFVIQGEAVFARDTLNPMMIEDYWLFGSQESPKKYIPTGAAR